MYKKLGFTFAGKRLKLLLAKGIVPNSTIRLPHCQAAAQFSHQNRVTHNGNEYAKLTRAKIEKERAPKLAEDSLAKAN